MAFTEAQRAFAKKTERRIKQKLREVAAGDDYGTWKHRELPKKPVSYTHLTLPTT